MAIATLVAGANGLANFVGNITYNGSLDDVRRPGDFVGAEVAGGDDLRRPDAARAAPISWTASTACSIMVGDYAADSAALDPSMLAGVTQPLAAAAKTPIGPVATSIGNAVLRTAHNFNSAGHIKVVNFPGGGAVRITDANIDRPERCARKALRRQRRDLLLAVGRPADRRRYRRWPAADFRRGGSACGSRAPERR